MESFNDLSREERQELERWLDDVNQQFYFEMQTQQHDYDTSSKTSFGYAVKGFYQDSVDALMQRVRDKDTSLHVVIYDSCDPVMLQYMIDKTGEKNKIPVYVELVNSSDNTGNTQVMMATEDQKSHDNLITLTSDTWHPERWKTVKKQDYSSRVHNLR